MSTSPRNRARSARSINRNFSKSTVAAFDFFNAPRATGLEPLNSLETVFFFTVTLLPAVFFAAAVLFFPAAVLCFPAAVLCFPATVLCFPAALCFPATALCLPADGTRLPPPFAAALFEAVAFISDGSFFFVADLPEVCDFFNAFLVAALLLARDPPTTLDGLAVFLDVARLVAGRLADGTDFLVDCFLGLKAAYPVTEGGTGWEGRQNDNLCQTELKYFRRITILG